MQSPSPRDTAPLKLSALTVHVYRVPLERPVATSFGIMRDRAAVLVRLADAEGAIGWGEIWCNFPGVGAEHRARLAVDELGPLVLGRSFAHPAAFYAHLAKASRIMAIQSGERGPFAQATAGLDMAMWDLYAHRLGVPLRQALEPGARGHVGCYASGMDVRQAPAMLEGAARRNYRAFKIKVGYGVAGEMDLVRQAAATVPAGGQLMADANQAWSLDQALAFVRDPHLPQLVWLEEPLAADAPAPEWALLAAESAAPIAAGENMSSDAEFDAAIAARCIRVLQPDAAKWGGLTATLAVARRAQAGGMRYCPHYLGGGVGLMASAHLLAAAGGDGLLEVDTNPNPLRSEIFEPALDAEGRLALPTTPGLGLAPDTAALARWRVATLEAKGAA